ncbi:hypothetical protein ACFL2R_00830 [Patescibacteria group bacterium]
MTSKRVLISAAVTGILYLGFMAIFGNEGSKSLDLAQEAAEIKERTLNDHYTALSEAAQPPATVAKN